MPPSSASSSSNRAALGPWIERFGSLHILVWGDVVADRFLYGSTTRVSREAPALVLNYEDEEIRPGGAGNAMLNVAALGARVSAAGFIGDDVVGTALLESLQRGGVDTDLLVTRANSGTPVKTRVMAGGVHTVRQQVLRIDQASGWAHDDRAKALELVNETQAMLDAHEWSAEYHVPLVARLAALRYRAGDGERAREQLASAVTFSECVAGPSDAMVSGCDTYDYDSDGDVDLADISSYQLAYAGANH